MNVGSGLFFDVYLSRKFKEVKSLALSPYSLYRDIKGG